MTSIFQALYTLSFVAADQVATRLETVKQEKGASAVEYALLVGLIAAAVVASVAIFRPMLEGLFRNINVNGR